MHQLHVALFNEECAQFDITPLQYSLLSALAVRGSADQTTLAADVFLDRTTTTGALKRLASRRLLTRKIDSRDRRAQVCSMTERGAEMLDQMAQAARQAHGRTLACLTGPEQQLMIGFMKRITAA